MKNMKQGAEEVFYPESISVKNYYKDIKKTKVLSGDDQIQLAIEAKAGNKEAFDKLIKSNLRFVVSVAKEYTYSGIPLEDLISEGNIGLIEAVSRFDENKGFKFISYAVWWIRHALIKSVNDHAGNIRLPVNRINSIRKIVRTKELLFQQLGREATDEEILNAIDDVTESDIKSFNINGKEEVSIDSRITSESDSDFSSFLAGDSFERFEEEMNHKALKRELESLFVNLTDREKTVLSMYFGLNGEEPATLRDIAEHLNLTNERVRQIKEGTLRRLRVFEKSMTLRKFLNINLGSGE